MIIISIIIITVKEHGENGKLVLGTCRELFFRSLSFGQDIMLSLETGDVRKVCLIFMSSQMSFW